MDYLIYLHKKYPLIIWGMCLSLGGWCAGMTLMFIALVGMACSQ